MDTHTHTSGCIKWWFSKQGHSIQHTKGVYIHKIIKTRLERFMAGLIPWLSLVTIDTVNNWGMPLEDALLKERKNGLYTDKLTIYSYNTLKSFNNKLSILLYYTETLR